MKKITLNNLKFIASMISLVAVGSYFYFTYKPPHEPRQRTAFRDLKCPDAYQTKEERDVAFQDFVDYYYEYNPSGSLEYLADSRKEFYIRHDCTEALKMLDDYESGNIDPETEQAVQRVISETFGQ